MVDTDRNGDVDSQTESQLSGKETAEQVRKRVVFVGIDGATWEIIEPMVAEGRLPNLAAMMREGSYGPLRSTYPPNSSLAWSSFLTGVDPGKHGVFFFREQCPGSYKRPVISFDSIQAPSIFNLASAAGRKVVSAWMPLTYPPEQINGVMIAGLLTPDAQADFITPKSVRAELEKRHGRIPSDNEPELLFHTADAEQALNCLLETTDKITEVAIDLLEREDPDLFVVVFRGVDLASHQSWCFQDPAWARKNPAAAARQRHVLGMVYERVDAALGRIVAVAAELEGEVSVGVCSDHGFGAISHRFFINKWLIDNGWLVLKKGSGGFGRLRLLLEKKWAGLMRRTGIAKKRMQRGKGIGRDPEAAIRDMIDWSQTRAWSSFSGGEDIVLVNLKGREPEGIVEPGAEYEDLRSEIIVALEKVRGDDGTQLITKAYRREDLWSGPQLHLAPDIQYITHETSVNSCANPLHPRVSEPAVEGRPAMHRIDGVYLWKGAGVFRAGAKEKGPRITDMAATIMHLLGLPVDDHMDGVVMEQCFEADWLRRNPVQMRHGTVVLSPRVVAASTTDDDEKLIETMRALGYME